MMLMLLEFTGVVKSAESQDAETHTVRVGEELKKRRRSLSFLFCVYVGLV